MAKTKGNGEREKDFAKDQSRTHIKNKQAGMAKGELLTTDGKEIKMQATNKTNP